MSEKPQNFEKYKDQGAYHWISMKKSWKTSYNPYLDARYQVALSSVPQTQQALCAADLGCGDGYFSNLLVQKGYKVIGVDGNATAISLAQKLVPQTNGGFFKVGNVYDTGLEAASLDLVCTLDVIEHLDRPEAFLEEIKRISKPSAQIVIGTPIRITEIPLDKYHVQEFFPSEFEQLLKKYFSTVAIKKSHPAEYLGLMRRKFNFFGRKKNLGWNIVNLMTIYTGKNPLLEENSEFPSYQFAICKL